jgi:hypothetical protein
VLRCVVLCSAVLCCVVLGCGLAYFAVLCAVCFALCVVSDWAGHRCAKLFCAVLCCDALSCTYYTLFFIANHSSGLLPMVFFFSCLPPQLHPFIHSIINSFIHSYIHPPISFFVQAIDATRLDLLKTMAWILCSSF